MKLSNVNDQLSYKYAYLCDIVYIQILSVVFF